MNSATASAIRAPLPAAETAEPAEQASRFPSVALALTILFFGFGLLPRINSNPRLLMSFLGVAGALVLWEVVVWRLAERRKQALRIEFAAIKSHYVQACAQLCLLLYWGWFARDVYAELPLILGQLVFLYIFDALFSWTTGRTWRVGFGPLPIILSTNLLLWFKDDWYFLQFAMVTVGALGKNLILWNREGRRRHIFNPSSFGQFIFALALIATATTDELTWGTKIATTFEVPHMVVLIFLVGLVVQYLFQVTLMTFAAAATLVLVNVIYTQITGVYFFVNISIAAPIFLGIHLLITDPSTSPVTNSGRVIFGVLYALGYTILFRLLDLVEVPLFWDKLLPVPILNLCVPLIDRIARAGVLGKLNTRWETALPPHRMNLVHMGGWIALFAGMMATGFIDAPHPGSSVEFWKNALKEGRPHAGNSLVMAAGSHAEGANSGAAFNELGLICMEGTIVNENHGTAARYFSRACELGDVSGCANCAVQYLFLGERRSDEDVARALDTLEAKAARDPDSVSCFLVGHAYEKGRGRPQDLNRALELYARSGLQNLFAGKGIARIMIATGTRSFQLDDVIASLETAAANGDDESCWYLAYMYADGIGVDQNTERASAFMRRACELGLPMACSAMASDQWPAFTNPIMSVPGWSTSYPLEP